MHNAQVEPRHGVVGTVALHVSGELGEALIGLATVEEAHGMVDAHGLRGLLGQVLTVVIGGRGESLLDLVFVAGVVGRRTHGIGHVHVVVAQACHGRGVVRVVGKLLLLARDDAGVLLLDCGDRGGVRRGIGLLVRLFGLLGGVAGVERAAAEERQAHRDHQDDGKGDDDDLHPTRGVVLVKSHEILLLSFRRGCGCSIGETVGCDLRVRSDVHTRKIPHAQTKQQRDDGDGDSHAERRRLDGALLALRRRTGRGGDVPLGSALLGEELIGRI